MHSTFRINEHPGIWMFSRAFQLNYLEKKKRALTHGQINAVTGVFRDLLRNSWNVSVSLANSRDRLVWRWRRVTQTLILLSKLSTLRHIWNTTNDAYFATPYALRFKFGDRSFSYIRSIRLSIHHSCSTELNAFTLEETNFVPRDFDIFAN